MKKSDPNKTKHRTSTIGTDISLFIIAGFFLFIVVFIAIGYNCCRRKKPKRKTKAHQRKIIKGGSQNENGQLLASTSHSEESLDPEGEDPGRSRPFEEKPKNEEPSRSFLSRIMSTFYACGANSTEDTQASGSGRSDSNSTSTSNHKDSPSNHKENSKKDTNQSRENKNKEKSEPSRKNESKNIVVKQPESFEMQTKKSGRSPTGKDQLHHSPQPAGLLAGFCRKKGKEPKKNTKCNCTGGSTCYKCRPYIENNSDQDDIHNSDDHHDDMSAKNTKSVTDPLNSSAKQVVDSRKNEGSHGADSGSNFATGKTSDEGKGRMVSGGSKSRDKIEYAPISTKPESKSGKNSGRSDGIAKQKKHGNTLGEDSGDQEPNNMDVDEHDFDIITSADLGNDRRNGQKLEEPPIRGGTEDIVDSDGYMVVTAYQRDNKRNKQGFQDERTRPRGEASFARSGTASGGRTVEKPPEKRVQSVGETYNVIQYARNEWKSDTATARSVREGYYLIIDELGLTKLRVIRGDNYCAIRATLFQVLVQNIPVLDRLKNIEQIPQQLIDSGEDWIENWTFASRINVKRENFPQMMGTCLKELCALVDLSSGMDKEGRLSHLLSVFNFKPFDFEFRLLEAVKFLMLHQAVQLHREMKAGRDVPVFAMIMFARDTSEDPWHFMMKHLNYVGDTGGLEQVEMHLLGYTLGVTIKVVRPSHVGQSDFIASYPEDMPKGTPVVALVAEDDRHYNILS